jgi:hypothetical protein
MKYPKMFAIRAGDIFFTYAGFSCTLPILLFE